MDDLGFVVIVAFCFAFLVGALVWRMQSRDLKDARMRSLDAYDPSDMVEHD